MRLSIAYLIFLASLFAASAENKTNFAVLDSLIRETALKICWTTGDNSSIYITNHNAAWLLRVRLAEECKGVLLTHLDTASITIGFAEFGVRYERLKESDDSLLRICTVAIAESSIDKSGRLTNISIAPQMYHDIIAEKDVVLIENGGYDFARAAIPPLPSSFFHEIIEPITVVAVAAITVFLLFTIRTQ